MYYFISLDFGREERSEKNTNPDQDSVIHYLKRFSRSITLTVQELLQV